MEQVTSFPKNKIRIALLEGVHPDGEERLITEGFNVESYKKAFDEQELLKVMDGIFVLGIRSNTFLTKQVFTRARRLLAVGAFCIGTNQIDLAAAAAGGIPVFNAPFSNTRSVAELVITDVIMLLRRLPDKIRMAHEGKWEKDSSGSMEVRGKTLGIVGYGHIGSQVSVLAESLGMTVVYHDIVDKLTLGNARRASGLKSLMEQSDVVTMHVPETPLTKGMIGEQQLRWMKAGSVLINTSRGTVVDVAALAQAIRSGHLSGAAVDVFPKEPKSASELLATPLQGLPNVILTPHIGGATVEAQRNISLEVATKLIRFVNNGSTEGAVNFPNVVLPELEGAHRILHIHRNVPGVMQKVNTMFGEAGINIEAQFLRTQGDLGYLIMDTNKKATREMVARLRLMPETIKIRAIF
jgi:D-3-phosphoglycerate dehydrogenase